MCLEPYQITDAQHFWRRVGEFVDLELPCTTVSRDFRWPATEAQGEEECLEGGEGADGRWHDEIHMELGA